MTTTRLSAAKVLGNERFGPTPEFPLEKLPTLKQVLERFLDSANIYRTDVAVRLTSEELHTLWVKFNVFQIWSMKPLENCM